MSYSEKMWSFADLSTMTDDPSESNPKFSEDYALEESIWHTPSFEIVQKKGSIFGIAFGRLLSCLPTGLTWIWILPPGYAFLYYKVNFWLSYDEPRSVCQWKCLPLSICEHFRVINYDLWNIRVKSNFFWGFHSWREYVAYPILWNCAWNKWSIFGVKFGRLLSCLPTGFFWIWILPPGCEYLSCKFSCWYP